MATVCCVSHDSATLCVLIRGGSVLGCKDCYRMLCKSKIVPPSVSQSGVAVFQVARMATACCVSHDSATLCFSIRSGSVSEVARMATVCCVSQDSATLCVSIKGGSVSGRQDGYCMLC